MAASSKGSAMFQKLKVGPMKRLYKYYTPQAINVAGGVPMDSIFPFKHIDVGLASSASSAGDNLRVTNGSTLHMNYLRGDGTPRLKEWIHNHAKRLHNPTTNFQSCVTVGSTDAFTKALMLFNGDTVVFDKFAYGTAVATCGAFGRHALGVDMDEQGMKADSLREQVLRARARGLRPDLVYLIPTAQNPTGVTISNQRKKELYQVCCDLDLIIIEDDAYYYIHFEKEGSDGDGATKGDSYALGDMPGVTNLPQSLWSMDTQGRVLRLDSLSKSVAPGMRLGWISGPSDVVEKYQLLQEISSQFPSGFSQSIFTALVDHWGHDGFDAHVRSIQSHYKKQRDVMHSSLAENLATYNLDRTVSFNKPTGGMFMWLQLQSGPPSEELFKQLAAAGVITVPGGDFMVPSLDSAGAFSPTVDPPVVRLTYAAAQPQQIRDAMKRLASGLKSIGV